MKAILINVILWILLAFAIANPGGDASVSGGDREAIFDLIRQLGEIGIESEHPAILRLEEIGVSEQVTSEDLNFAIALAMSASTWDGGERSDGGQQNFFIVVSLRGPVEDEAIFFRLLDEDTLARVSFFIWDDDRIIIVPSDGDLGIIYSRLLGRGIEDFIVSLEIPSQLFEDGETPVFSEGQ